MHRELKILEIIGLIAVFVPIFCALEPTQNTFIGRGE